MKATERSEPRARGKTPWKEAALNSKTLNRRKSKIPYERRKRKEIIMIRGRLPPR